MTGPVTDGGRQARALAVGGRAPSLEADSVTRANVPMQSATSNDEWGYATRLMHDESCR